MLDIERRVFMTPVQILFIIVGAVTLGAALMVVTARNLVHAALWLIVAFGGVAVFFVLLNAYFLAVAQVVIYIGAIAILMIFAIMMTRNVTGEKSQRFNTNQVLGLILVVVLFAGLVWMFASWGGATATVTPLDGRADPVRDLGTALVAPDGYLVAFELVSILLLGALIGALMIAWDKK
jgi:NADH-quinone oxidoreductase subunit J